MYTSSIYLPYCKYSLTSFAIVDYARAMINRNNVYCVERYYGGEYRDVSDWGEREPERKSERKPERKEGRIMELTAAHLSWGGEVTKGWTAPSDGRVRAVLLSDD